MRYTKTFLSPAEQVQLLADRGMEIQDRARAERCLARIGYYRLSAYWYSFRASARGADGRPVIGDTFRDGTSFATIHSLYVFDKTLRLIVMDALERIEVSVRTQIALTMGAVDPWAHRDAANLRSEFTEGERYEGAGETGFEYWLRELDRKARYSKEDFADHFRRKYPQDPLPVWVAVELWDFGTLSHFYAGMKQADKDRIAKVYGVPPGRVFETWIRCLNDVRNLCAHHSRLFNRPLVNHPKLPDARGTLPAFGHIRDVTRSRRRLYMALLIIRHMLQAINPTSGWKTRLVDHIATLPPNGFVTLDSAGFPENWTALPVWADPE